MRNLLILVSCFFIYSAGYTQILNDVDEVTPFHDNLAAIKKNNEWAFINKAGEKIINFRGDLVATIDEHFIDENGISSVNYPVFHNGRCLIRKLIDGTYYYGYINKEGDQLIEPQYLNATNFVNGYAIIIKIGKNIMGNNLMLGKNVVNYKLEEYIIDTSGKTIKYLDNARNDLASRNKTRTPPSFCSKFIAPHLIAVMSPDKKWNIYEF